MSLSVELRQRYRDFTLDLRFDAPPGVTVLFGHSGAGKTSVVQAVAGLTRPEAGRIALGDEVLFDHAARLFQPPHRRRIGYVFQDARLFPHLSVAQNLGYGRWFNRAARALDAAPLIEMLGLGPLIRRRTADLSGGERARVALGRALLSAPRLLLLDEPLAALDAARKAEVLPYLERLRDELALPMLYVTHSVDEAMRLGTTLVVLEAGRLAAMGPPETVFRDPALVRLLGAAETGAVITARRLADEADGLCRWQTQAGPIWLPARPGGAAVIRLRILAQDVILARARPEGLSALNVLPGVVERLEDEGAQVLVHLALGGGEGLLARITRRSAQALDLAPGQSLQAIVKTASLAGGRPDAG